MTLVKVVKVKVITKDEDAKVVCVLYRERKRENGIW